MYSLYQTIYDKCHATYLHLNIADIYASRTYYFCPDGFGNGIVTRSVMVTGEAEVFSKRLKRELHVLKAANVHTILESEHLVDEVLQGLELATILLKIWMNGWHFLM